jgi:hypothetical protein
MRVIPTVFMIFAIIVAVPRMVIAEDVDAHEHFRRGSSAYQRGDYEIAIREWLLAYETTREPMIQYNLALVYERSGRIRDAVNALQSYINTADRKDQNYSDASARLASLQQRLALTGIVIIGGAEGATVTIDGVDWGRLPRPDKIPVKPDFHRIVIHKNGYRDFISAISVPEGQVLKLSVNMDPIDGTESQTQVTEADSEPPAVEQSIVIQRNEPQSRADAKVDDKSKKEEPGFLSKPLVWYIGSGVFAAGGIATAVWWADRASALSDCQDPTYACMKEDAIKSNRNLAMGLTIGLGVAAVGSLVVAIILSQKDQSPTPKESAVACVPYNLLGARCIVRY